MAEPTKITFYGHSMFLIEASDKTKIGTDPYNQQVKDRLPEVSADIVLVSHHHFDHANTSLFKGNPTVLDTGQKTTIKGIDFEGIPAYHDQSHGNQRGENIIFKFTVDGITFAHMGDLGHQLSSEQYQKLQNINILMLPVGGIFTIDSRIAHQIINDIKPNIAIPMHYKQQDTKIDVDTIDKFLKQAGKYRQADHTISITGDQLPEPTEIWVLKSS